MPYTLNIKIEGTRITDDDAKIIGLSMMGLGYNKIYQVTFINEHCIRNKVSALYGLLDTERNITALTVLGELNRFDHYCHVNGVDILDADERRRLAELNPLLLRASKRICITLL